ncbi:MAG: AMP-binding protein [Burkholderiales bacterium]
MPAASVSTGIALFVHERSSDVVAYDKGRRITAGEFLSDAAALAERLPRREFVLNLCANRYLFTVGLVAAMIRRQVTLLPSSQSAATLAALGEGYSGLYVLADRPQESAFATVEVARTKRNVPFVVPSVPSTATALILFTSGSTGQPVPTAKTWGSLVYSAQSEALSLGLERGSGWSILGTVPAQHSYGLESTVLLALHQGLALDGAHPFYPADVCSALDALPRPRMLVTTPVHLRALCAMEEDLPHADLLLSATAPLATDLAEQAEAKFHGKLMEIYGCSEAGQLAFRTPVQSIPWRLMRGVRMRQDSAGTWVHGGHVPAETLLADVIEVVDDEHFVLRGRTADLVNVAGKRTSLDYLNHQLYGIGGVEDGVFFMPDSESGEARVSRLVAFVVAPGMREEDLRAALRERIDAAFMPRPIHLLEALPRNSTGKIPREVLVALAGHLRKDQEP